MAAVLKTAVPQGTWGFKSLTLRHSSIPLELSERRSFPPVSTSLQKKPARNTLRVDQKKWRATNQKTVSLGW